jgi:hypothetical protein
MELGTDMAVSVSFDEVGINEMDLMITYNHKGDRKGHMVENLQKKVGAQPDFPGTLALNVLLSTFEMKGTIFTNRYDEKTETYGTSGKLVFARYKKDVEGNPNDVLDAAIKGGFVGKLEERIIV